MHFSEILIFQREMRFVDRDVTSMEIVNKAPFYHRPRARFEIKDDYIGTRLREHASRLIFIVHYSGDN